jgi:hypothetical protein
MRRGAVFGRNFSGLSLNKNRRKHFYMRATLYGRDRLGYAKDGGDTFIFGL